MKAILFLPILLILLSIKGQYTTPNTGVVWNMDSLVQNSTAVQFISANNYRVVEDLTILASDSLYALNNNIRFANGVTITIAGGGLLIDGGINFGDLIADVSGESYEGFRLEGNAHVSLNRVSIMNCGGIKVLTPNFLFTNSSAIGNPTGINSSAFIELSSGKPAIDNNVFKDNEVSAVSSAANATVAPMITNNTFEGNVTSNTNRPQINLSPSGTDTTYIINNIITGNRAQEMAGGVAFSALAGGVGNVVIKDNEIQDNRYGIAILGNGLTALIENNEILNNDSQNNSNLGGSGINLSGNNTSSAIITKNTIKGNLWGITVLNNFSVNLGDSHIGGSNSGENVFSENENGGETYALFNNTPSAINATNNCWELNEESTLLIAESVISHQEDDNTLGEVIFDPILFCNSVTVEEKEENLISIYPNPASFYVKIGSKSSLLESITLMNLLGEVIIPSFRITSNEIELDVSILNAGIYVLIIKEKGRIFKQQLIVQ